MLIPKNSPFSIGNSIFCSRLNACSIVLTIGAITFTIRTPTPNSSGRTILATFANNAPILLIVGHAIMNISPINLTFVFNMLIAGSNA